MTRHLVLAAITVAIAGCSRAGTPPPPPDAGLQLVRAQQALGRLDYDLAESYVATAAPLVTTDDQRVTAFRVLAAVNAGRGDLRGAARQLAEAIRVRPGDAALLAERAGYRLQLARAAGPGDSTAWRQVLADAEPAAAARPADARTLAALAEAHFHLGRPDAAAREYREAVRLMPPLRDDARKLMPGQFP